MLPRPLATKYQEPTAIYAITITCFVELQVESRPMAQLHHPIHVHVLVLVHVCVQLRARAHVHVRIRARVHVRRLKLGLAQALERHLTRHLVVAQARQIAQVRVPVLVLAARRMAPLLLLNQLNSQLVLLLLE